MNKKVTILKHGLTYSLVRWGSHQGYMHNGMIFAFP